MMIFVVRAVPVTDLVKKLEAGQRILKEGVIRESRSNGIQLYYHANHALLTSVDESSRS
jgi:hypothetical protein